MQLTRTRLIIIGITGILIAAVGVVLAVSSGGGSPANTTRTFEDGGVGIALGGDGAEEPAVLRNEGDGGAPAEGYSAGETELNQTSSPGAALPQLLDRKIVQSSSIDLEVEEVGRQFQEIIRIAETAGGFVASSSFSVIDEQQVADLSIRVPADRYQGVLNELRGMGEVTLESSDASDVTEEYTDLEARLRALEATERRYLELLGEADEINEILQVQDRLDGVRGQIEQTQGRINLLNDLTDLATVTVHLRPAGGAIAATTTAEGGIHPINAAENAWDSSIEALRGIAAAALVVVVFSWWLVPPLALLALGARWWLGRKPRPAVESAA